MSNTPTISEAVRAMQEMWTELEANHNGRHHPILKSEMQRWSAALSVIEHAMAPPADWREAWAAHGGNFHGPNVETGTMPASNLASFVAALAAPAREPLTAQQMHRVAVNAQIAFNLDKHSSYDVALIRETEAAHSIKPKD